MPAKTQIQYINLDNIIPYANNPRNNDGEATDRVASSIKEYGFNVPLVLDKENVIICGHTRYKAAHKLGLKDVPCIYADSLTPAQVKAYRIADNKAAEFSSWNYDVLAIELEQLQELDFDIDLTGFVSDETENLNIDFDENDLDSEQDKNIVIVSLNCGKFENYQQAKEKIENLSDEFNFQMSIKMQ